MPVRIPFLVIVSLIVINVSTCYYLFQLCEKLLRRSYRDNVDLQVSSYLFYTERQIRRVLLPSKRNHYAVVKMLLLKPCCYYRLNLRREMIVL